jgi:1,4-dihydroxy-2-naphthoate polyprenyltransferase
VNPFVEAARPRTLPAALAPVLVGTGAAERALADTDPLRFGLALVVALALQVAVNYANDYFDGVGGIDTDARVGPRRAVAAGLVAPGRMKLAIGVALGVAALAGLALAALVGPELLVVGVLAVLAALGYSGGPRPYASAGLGEVSVFVFFGLVATVGSAYVQDGAVHVLPVLAAVPMGAFATALLVVNNLRDIPTDRDTGKHTLAVRLGVPGTRTLYAVLVVVAYLALVPVLALTGVWWVLLPLGSVPLAWMGLQLVRGGAHGAQLIVALGHTARAQLAFGVLLAAGLVVATGSAGASA